jgi:Ca2+-binding EF-hand superfamily protein
MLRSLAIAFTAFAGIAFGTANAAAPSFESLDKNSDGAVSLDEASANDHLFTAFKTLDANKDGKLTKEEFAAYKAA